MSNSKKSSPKKRLPSLALVARPDIRYAVQAALVNQKQQIYLINPGTNMYIDGLIDVPALYLTFTPPPMVTKRAFGFLPGPTSTQIILVPKELKIDAILYFSYPGNEYFAGYDKETGITVMLIKVWHDDEVKRWKRIAQKVASELVIIKGKKIIPTVFFNISSVFVPNNPKAPHQLIIKPDTDGGKYPDATPWIPSIFQDDDYNDE